MNSNLVKNELLYLKQYGFTDDLLSEIYIYNLNPLDVLFNKDSIYYLNVNHKFTNKEKELLLDFNEYLTFRKNFYENYFVLDKFINKIFFKFDDNEISKLIPQNILPLFIYCSGNFQLLTKKFKRAAIVGTRNPSIESFTKTKKIVENLVNENYVIVSGLAEGIDTIAHLASFQFSGKTIAVLPTNFYNIYPKSNWDLLYKIGKDGLLITAIGPNENTYKSSFLDRNKYIAAISDIVIIIETNLKSGTMNTIRNAFELNKKIYFLRQEDEAVNKKILEYGGILID